MHLFIVNILTVIQIHNTNVVYCISVAHFVRVFGMLLNFPASQFIELKLKFVMLSDLKEYAKSAENGIFKVDWGTITRYAKLLPVRIIKNVVVRRHVLSQDSKSRSQNLFLNWSSGKT